MIVAKYEEMIIRIGFVFVANEKDFFVARMIKPKVDKTNTNSTPRKRAMEVRAGDVASTFPETSTHVMPEATTAIVISQIANVSLR
jgi:hypothetical protein